MSSDLIVRVALENTKFSFDKSFDYSVPDNLRKSAVPGVRVLAPFGRGNRKRQGIIMSAEYSDTVSKSLKSILKVLDDSPVLSEEMLKTAEFMKEHYFCTLYDAVKTMLPAGINYRITTLYGVKDSGSFDESSLDDEQRRIYDYLFTRRRAVRSDVITDAFGFDNTGVLDDMVSKGALYKSDETFRRVADAVAKMAAPAPGVSAENVRLTPKQQSVYELIELTGGISVKEVCYFTGVTAAVIDALHKKNLIYFYDEEVFRIENRAKDITVPPITLSPEQQKACDSLYREYTDEKPHTSLLYGVTGSGKTSVFIKLIEKVIDDDRGIIVMVPEISLTPQFVEIFSKRFGDKIAVFHSALSLGERLDEYKRVKKGIAKIVIGTRSAVFAPFENIGLIIMDEEQEYSYKSESNPRYHAREIAKFRCGQSNGLLVLSSATPSVETFYYAQNSRYSINVLPKRYGTATLPDIVIADMNTEMQNGNTSGFSEVLLQNLEYNLEHGRQSILLLNRRGHNTFVTCRFCGEPVTCPNCSISLTYHSKNNRLMCHYCGYSIPYTDECPTCHSKNLRFGGTGTQKAEKDISEIFPEARILRMDADTTSSKSSYEKMIFSFSNGDYDILVGTQMVAKGLDFPNVTLVGVLNTDHMLYADDYRSYERSFSLLTQVVGRSGRGKSKGMAVIQSYTPENQIISMAAKQDYAAFYNTEINIRKAMLYPPFADICLIGFVGENQSATLNAAREFLKSFAELAGSKYPDLPLRVLGPSPALVVKVSNKFRYKLIIKCKNNRKFRSLLSTLLIYFGKNKEFANVTVYADMNAFVC
ncbi:MAG: primosomal protein N' [Clostridiales bacterium]|nr:primosomal protein N' [Clostridiales bacterium]